MKLVDFKVEQWMNDHEHQAIFNMTDTCCKALSFGALKQLEPLNLDDMILDYGQITGDPELKHEILKLYKTGTIDNITMAQGCLQANELVMNTLLEKDDEVITCVPGYQQFYDLPRSIGCKVHLVELKESEEWRPSIDKFVDLINENTKMIILNNPNNPTGTEFDRSFMNDLIDLCRKYHTYILCDEVYRGLNDEISISDIYEYGIATASLSKVYSLAGLRLGWIKSNLDVIGMINVRRDYSIISTGPLIDHLGSVALKHKDELLDRSKTIVSQNKQLIQTWIENEPHFSVVMPKGGTVSLLRYDLDIDSETLARCLLVEKGIFFVPGSCFDIESHLRLGLAMDPEMLKQGLIELSKWVDTNQNFC